MFESVLRVLPVISHSLFFLLELIVWDMLTSMLKFMCPRLCPVRENNVTVVLHF